MTGSNSVRMPEATTAAEERSRLLDRTQMIERLATEMRLRSGGDLPQSFCVAQVKWQLSGKQAEALTVGDRTERAMQAAAARGGAVFRSWALPD